MLSSLSLSKILSWKPSDPITKVGLNFKIFSKEGSILPSLTINFSENLLSFFKREDPGIPTKESLSNFETISAPNEFKLIILFFISSDSLAKESLGKNIERTKVKIKKYKNLEKNISKN